MPLPSTTAYVPLDQVAAFEKLLAAAPFPSRCETEPGTHHGYAFSDRGNLNEAAREKHYERMLALYRRHLDWRRRLHAERHPRTSGHRARRLRQAGGPALRAEAERLGARRVFVTTSKSVAQSALLADVVRDLGDRYAGVYSGITAHSPRPCVIEGARLAREAGADLHRRGGRRLGDRRHQGDADRAVAGRRP